ncbi:hypothetical protein [Aureimonas ureilytica]|uniref:hypothetical protein n=1 Tax=Aureimonas ureilytica TaxID=401562 RepID=UPI000A6C9C5E|nr:hypothetical protein [Aureimonas ureilytica]
MPKSSGSNHRDASSGQFTTSGKAGANKAGHQAEPRGKSGDGPGSPYRDTDSGQFVTQKYAKANPKTTVREK